MVNPFYGKSDEDKAVAVFAVTMDGDNLIISDEEKEIYELLMEGCSFDLHEAPGLLDRALQNKNDEANGRQEFAQTSLSGVDSIPTRNVEVRGRDFERCCTS
jgi:hypothetical protein